MGLLDENELEVMHATEALLKQHIADEEYYLAWTVSEASIYEANLSYILPGLH